MSGRPMKEPEVEAQIRAEFQLGRQNRTKVICERHGISKGTLMAIVRNEGPRRQRRAREYREEQAVQP